MNPTERSMNPGPRAPWALPLLACGLHLSAPAQSLPAPLADPTRPSTAVVAPVADGAPQRSAEPAAPRVWPKLQSTWIPVHGDPSAVIDGRLVRLGERVGDALLVAIDAQSVVLRTPRYLQHIGLTPGVAKTASVATAPTHAQPTLAALAKDHP